MKRLASLVGLLVLLALLSSSAALAGPPVYQVSGGGTTDTEILPGWEGPEWAFGFNAQIDAEGVVRGQLEVNELTSEPSQLLHVDIDCLVVEGNRAWLSGQITQSELMPGWIGLPVGMIVEDNGQGQGAAPDLWDGWISFPPIVDYCEYLHDNGYQPETVLTNGNVQIKP